MTRTMPIIIALGLLFLAVSAAADTVTTTVVGPGIDVFGDTTLDVDFGATLSGISEVTVTVAGYSGAKRLDCGYTGLVELPWYLSLTLDNGASAWFVLEPLYQDYEFTATLDLPAEADWSTLEDGQVQLSFAFSYESQPGACFPAGGTGTSLDLATVTATCDLTVANEATAWGAIKATFR